MQVQSDGTSWMAMYSLNMLRIAIELAQEDDAYQDIATKFFEHFLMIGGAMTNLGGKGLSLWDDTDNFFYDWLVMSNGEATPLRVRSLVGLIPAFAVETIDADVARRTAVVHPAAGLVFALSSQACGPGVPLEHAGCRRYAPARHRPCLPLVQGDGTRSGPERIPVGLRDTLPVAISSRASLRFRGRHFRSEVKYVPAESDSDLFGGNSNWRGPIWMPINYLFIESVNKFAKFYGDDFKLECPVGSGEMLSLRRSPTSCATA
jgi:hypothetical protein